MSERTDDQWEKEDVDVTRPVAAVVSVRFPEDVVAQIYAEAQKRGVRISTLIREIVEEYLAGGLSSGTTVDLSISSAEDVPVTLYTGRGTYERTEGAPSRIELVQG